MAGTLHIAHDSRFDRNAGVGLQDGDELTTGVGQIDMMASDSRLGFAVFPAACHAFGNGNFDSFRHDDGQRVGRVRNPVADGGQIKRNLRNENHIDIDAVFPNCKVRGMNGN